MADHLDLTAPNTRWNFLVEIARLVCDENVKLEVLTKKEATSDDCLSKKHGKRSARRPIAGTWIRPSRTRMELPDILPAAIIKNPKKRTRMELPDILGEIIKNPKQSSSCASKIAKGKDIVEGHVMVTGHRNEGPMPPETIKNRILEIGGSLESVVFLIEKDLYEADVKTGQSRLSVPCRKVKNKFLDSKEVETLESKGKFPTILIQPSLEECQLSFGYWPSNTTYALYQGWNHVLKSPKNRLKEMTRIRLWSFRRDSTLCFALMKMD